MSSIYKVIINEKHGQFGHNKKSEVSEELPERFRCPFTYFTEGISALFSLKTFIFHIIKKCEIWRTFPCLPLHTIYQIHSHPRCQLNTNNNYLCIADFHLRHKLKILSIHNKNEKNKEKKTKKMYDDEDLPLTSWVFPHHKFEQTCYYQHWTWG